MSQRLSPQPGEWIDRAHKVRFRFEGVDYTGFAGDTISSALMASGVRMLGRSFKYHRPRGVLSMANHDSNNIVQTSTVTNIRADVIPVHEGGDFNAVNTFGGLRRDSARIVDWFGAMLPVGFYYKAFHTPRSLFPFYERKMRAMAGLGAINANEKWTTTPKAYDFCDVAVIGAGPAGLAAAISAGETGASVLVIDENARPGGSLGYQHRSDSSAPSRLDELLARVKSMPNVRLKVATEVSGYYADHWLALTDATRLTKLRAKSVIFATGAIEQPSVFRNNDLAGVMLASAAQRLISRYAVKPFERVVVIASNADAYRAVLDFRAVGIDVAAVVDLRPKPDLSPAAREVAGTNVRIFQHHAVTEAIPGKGKTSIVGARIQSLNEDGTPAHGPADDILCDGIAMSVGWMPCDGLINQAGGKFVYSDRLEQFVPQSLPPGIFVAGRANAIYELHDQFADGRRAGMLAASSIGKYQGHVPAVVENNGQPASHPYPIFPHKSGKDFIDFDEDVQYKDIKHAVQEGFDSVELIKRYTTLGMGPSQGKVANMNGIRALAHVRQQSIAETGTTTSRPFIHPVDFRHLAGRGFHPHRHTAMHAHHESAGAVFMPAGAWLRPAYYASTGKTREDAITAEVRAVRDGVGMIDVGTLGKIEVAGPDACEFIERTYTGRFAKMQPGTTRYLLLCDESGVVVDDGVVTRLAPDHFYLTSTTTGADGVYREMQRNAQLWCLDVVLINLTGSYAAVNLAGPNSRRLLQGLTEIKLDQESFPYLAARTGTVAEIPARLLRVGFVGELGYEIHVPAEFGFHLWEQLIRAGSQFGIKPFGVEAQRILRLEKGHAIIGQDTDGLTNPFEAGMDWAVKLDKSFFIGQRSLKIVSRKPITRALVGFVLTDQDPGATPKECHLVIDGETISGRVTSVAFSPTLKRVVGMAYVRKDQAAVGSRFTIRIDGGRLIQAEVVKLPFYDPESRRQHETDSPQRETNS